MATPKPPAPRSKPAPAPVFQTSNEEIDNKYKRVSEGFRSGKTLDLDFRRSQLRNIYYAIADNEEKLKQALEKDLHRAPFETEILELNACLTESKLAVDSVESWAKDKSLGLSDIKVSVNSPHLKKTPYGVVLIQSPWNYPYLCSVLPVISAIAAGNTVLLKPTEVAVESTKALAEILEKALDPSVFQVVLGSVPEASYLLSLKWDKIMLTGSCPVGKVVAKAAAEHLTPIVLELGGKSPVFVSRKADLKLAAKRLAWGKFINAGQTCIAPDYVIVERAVEEQFVEELKKAVSKLYPNLTKDSADFAHIISDRHYARAAEFVGKTRGKVWQGGVADPESRFFPPTIVSGVDIKDILMTDELFMPVLPLTAVDDIEWEGPELVHLHDTPLSLYIFTDDKKQADRLIAQTRSGAVMVNDCVVQGGSAIVPFGGVGTSGVGRYHGKFGFDEFSYDRPVLTQPKWTERLLEARYAPYRPFNGKQMRLIDRPWFVSFGRTGRVRGSLFGRLFLAKWKIISIILLLLYLKK